MKTYRLVLWNILKEAFKGLLSASESSMDFWNNDIDDEVWNNV